MALEVVVLDKDEYKALIDNQADEDELEYLKACQYALESFNKVGGYCQVEKRRKRKGNTECYQVVRY